MYDIFPFNFVFWEPLDNHEEIKSVYLKKIRDKEHLLTQPHTWKCDVKSSFDAEDINQEIFDDYFLKHVVWSSFDKLLETRPFDFDVPTSSSVLNIWFNTYKKGQYQEIHNHLGSGSTLMVLSDEIPETFFGLFSGIYIIDSKESNKTVFYQEGIIPCNRSKNGFKKTTEKVKEGSVILFPSGLSHYATPAEDSRTTISFNIVSKYD